MSSSAIAAILKCITDLVSRWLEDLHDYLTEREPGVAGDDMVRLKILISRSTIEQAIAEIGGNPRIEVGGKFVGRVHGSVDVDAPGWREQLAGATIEILGYLDSGPAASRSSVHHLSDTAYQFALFQALLREFPDLDYVGLWHSHHPNGLRELSRGDLATGTGIVDGGQHDRDFLLSSLAVDQYGLLAGRHFVFLRGHGTCYEIHPASLVVVDEPTAVDTAIARERGRLRSTQAGRSAQAPPPSASRRSGPPVWTTTQAGRQAIAADRAWLARYPQLLPRISAGTLMWQGTVPVGEAEFACRYAYGDADPSVSPPRATVVWSRSGAEVEFELCLPGPRDREVTFTALLETARRTVTTLPGLHDTAQRQQFAFAPGGLPSAASWSSHPAGPGELALDDQWMRADLPMLSPVLRGPALLWTGPDEQLGAVISYAYTSDFPASGPRIQIRAAGESQRFGISARFAPLNVGQRRAAMTGCLREARSLAALAASAGSQLQAQDRP